MQAVLMEIRQLRRDVQTAATTARRAQILIFRYQEQMVMVEKFGSVRSGPGTDDSTGKKSVKEISGSLQARVGDEKSGRSRAEL